MGKAFIWGDWQLESRPSSDRLDDEGRSIRFAENRQALIDGLHAAKAAGCTVMVHLGDMTEDRDPDSATLKVAAEIFGLALKWGWEIYVIAGNHDGAIFNLSSSSFESFGMLHDRLHVFHEPKVVEVGGARCLFLPYLHRHSPEQVLERVKEAVADGPVKYVFAHYAYAGVQIGAKNMVLPGDHLDASIFQITGAKIAWFGHIHKQQVIEAPGGCFVYFVGSPYCNDFGEREDPKGYGFLDMASGKCELKQVSSMRRWLYINWRDLGTPKGRFEPEDLVKINGEYGPGESPQDAFKALLAAGKIKEPFYKVFELRRGAQDSKRGIVSASSGLQQALADYFSHRWPDDPASKDALVLASDALKSSNPNPYERSVVLKEVRMVDFLSHASAEVKFIPGEPMLVCGENGLGKTNLIEAVLFALTGQISKGLKMASLVRQGASKSSVELVLQGEREYRIRRTITLNSKGAAAHKVDVEFLGNGGKWTSLADGGVADSQAALGRLIGATFLSMRAINFQFQRDPNPFIGAEPSERKAILAEILGLEALGKSLKVLDEDRKVKMRAADAAEAVSDEAAGRYDVKEVERLEGELKAAEDQAPVLGGALRSAKAKTEAAVASAGAVGSERNSLQTVIDTLEGQMSGPADLTKSKADMEAAFQKGRAERGDAYAGAKKRAEEKAALAKDLPTLEAASAKADELEAKSLTLQAQTSFPDLEGKVEAATSASGLAAKAAVDTKLGARSAQQVKSDASAKWTGLGSQISSQVLEIDTLSSQDSKTCSKCGHALDQAHAEAELDKARATLEDLRKQEVLAKAAMEQAILDLSSAQSSETSAQAASEAATKAMNEATTALEIALEASKAEIKFAQAEAKAVALAAKKAVEAARLAAQDAGEAETERKKLLDAGLAAKAAHEKAIAELDVRIADAEKKAADAGIKVADARAKLEGIDARLQSAQNAVKSAKEGEKTAQDDVDACAASIAATGAAIQAQKDNEANAFEKKAAFDAAKKVWYVADMACTGMKELPAHLIDERLTALADLVNAYLAEFGSPEFSIAFSTRKDDGKETMDVLVDNGCEPRLDVAAYSGGQLDRISSCMRWALSDMAEAMRDVRLGFAMMDEPGTHLDEEKKGALIRMVKQRAADGRCPIAVIVSHDRKLQAALDRKITVTRDGIRED